MKYAMVDAEGKIHKLGASEVPMRIIEIQETLATEICPAVVTIKRHVLLDAFMYLSEKYKIEAIKILRMILDIGLLDAKNLVEAIPEYDSDLDYESLGYYEGGDESPPEQVKR